MTPIIADYTFKMCFNFLHSTGEASQTSRTRGNLPPTLFLDGLGCISNALINALKN